MQLSINLNFRKNNINNTLSYEILDIHFGI